MPVEKRRLIGALLFLVAITVGGFYFLSLKSKPDIETPALKIATLYWPGTYWIDVARTKGWFNDAGLDVEFVDANEDYYAVLDGLEHGAVDTVSIWLFDVIKRRQDGADIELVLATDESNGSEAIVSAPHIAAMPQLLNKRIGVPLETALVYELAAMLERFGMSLTDVTLVHMEPESASSTLASGDVDAVVTWEPHVSDAVASGGIRLYDSSKLPGLIMGGMAFRSDFIQSRSDDIKRMVRVWHRTTNYIKSNPDEAFAIVAQINKVSPEDAAQFAKRNRMLDLNENMRAFTYASGLESLHGSARRIQRFLVQQNEGKQGFVDETRMLNDEFIRYLAQDRSAL